MEGRILIRPMYVSDPGFIKGMKVAIIESTGEVVKRHFDNVGKHIPMELTEKYQVVTLHGDEIDWERAGYTK